MTLKGRPHTENALLQFLPLEEVGISSVDQASRMVLRKEACCLVGQPQPLHPTGLPSSC